MYRTFIKPLGLLTLLAFAGLFISCQKDENVADVENFTTQSVKDIEDGCGAGLSGCYELVFPVTVLFSDSTSIEVTNYDSLKQAIRNWFEANAGTPNHGGRPVLALPFQVINQAGEVITVETPEQAKELRALCHPILGGGGPGNGGPGNGGPGGHGGPGGPGGPGGGGHHGGGPGNGGGQGPCFTLAFPLTLSFADSTQVTVATPQELQIAVFTWNVNNPGQHARPEFVFPITVTLADGTQVIVNSKEELQAIKDACRG